MSRGKECKPVNTMHTSRNRQVLVLSVGLLVAMSGLPGATQALYFLGGPTGPEGACCVGTGSSGDDCQGKVVEIKLMYTGAAIGVQAAMLG